MTNTANFVKLNNGMIINIDSIDGIFPNKSISYDGGFAIQINGKYFHIDDEDILPIFDAIGINPYEKSSRSESFDPDKRIAVAPVDNFQKMFAKIKAAVDNYNTGRSLSRLTTKVDRDKKMITIERSTYSCIVIDDGIVIRDDLASDTYSELKTAINNILIEG